MTKEKIVQKIAELKKQSGSHSPSIETMLREIPELKIGVDACFLSNPYATKLFMDKLKQEIANEKWLEDTLSYYPPQNADLAKVLSSTLNVPAKNIFIGNGAIEIIQAAIHQFADKNIALPIPTFSSYYEYARNDCKVHYYNLKKENNYALDLNDYSVFIKNNHIDTAVIINPSNPTAEYISKENIILFLDNHKDLKNILLDISFIHFAYENENLEPINFESLILNYPNVILIKSMSKDFGIAGIRAGYGVMSEDKVKQLLQNGYLWNSSGLASYFFSVYSDKTFQNEYENYRKQYILEAKNFYKELALINGIKVLPSKNNFALVEILNGKKAGDVAMDMLINSNLYVRNCSDKIGLEGEYLRIAARSDIENKLILEALKKAL